MKINKRKNSASKDGKKKTSELTDDIQPLIHDCEYVLGDVPVEYHGHILLSLHSNVASYLVVMDALVNDEPRGTVS